MSRVVNIGAVAFIISLAFSFKAWAESTGECNSTGADKVVMIFDNASRTEMAPYIVAIASQLDDLPVCFRTEWRDGPMLAAEAGDNIARMVAEESNAVVVFWLVPAFKGYQLHLFLPLRTPEKEITRTVEVGGEDGLAETLAVIVRVSISTAIADRNIPTKREEPIAAARSENRGAPTLSSSEQIVKPETEREQIQVSAAYYVGASAENAAPTHGASLGIGVLTADFLMLFAQYTVMAPLELKNGGAGLSLERHPVWIGGDFIQNVGRLEIGAGIALGIDYLNETYSVLDGNTELQLEPESRVQISIVPMVSMSIKLIKILYLATTLSGEIVVNQYKYSINRDSNKVTVYDPWPIQPALTIGFELRFL